MSTQLSDCVPELAMPIGRAMAEWNTAHPQGPRVFIVQTKRLYSEALINYLKGRYLPNTQRVTNALPEEDPHVLTDEHGRCYACDIGFVRTIPETSGDPPVTLEAGTVTWASSNYAAFAKLVPELEWGGNWHTIHDEPHFQPPGWHWQDHVGQLP